MERKRNCFYWGLTAFLTVCAVLVFYDTVFQDGVLFARLRRLASALAPVLYGAVMAYLLAPVVNFFDRCIDRGGKEGSPRGLVRGGSILLTWAVVFFLLYVLFSILLPQIYLSVVTLAGNMQSYYNTVYAWVTQLFERYPGLLDAISSAINQYWTELQKWFTGTFLPQAQ